MADETFRPVPLRQRPTRESISEEHNSVAQPENVAPIPQQQPGIEVRGPMPPQFEAMLRSAPQQQQEQTTAFTQPTPPPHQRTRHKPRFDGATNPNNERMDELIRMLGNKTHRFEKVQLPSMGKFYNGSDGPQDGVVFLRPMTGQEEQILATPRFAKRGKAIDMIFEDCIQGKIDPGKLLSIDRTYLLIYLRIISHGPGYEVEVKCPECAHKYPSTVDLNQLSVETCPEEFGPESLDDVLPDSEFKFSYRLARGADDVEINQHRERRTKQWGDAARDDTMHYRTALLLNEIEGISDKAQIQQLASKLPIKDIAYIRDLINNPPFGIDTGVEMLCPSCYAEYTVDLPLESNFFFPSRKKSK